MNAKYHWFRWLCGAAAFLALAFAVGWFYEDVVKPARHAAMCKIHIKQLLTALHAYHDRHQCFPPAYTVGSDGERWHSWRVLLLPDLGEQKLYDAYRFDEPWNGPHNAPLGQRMPAVFGFPGEPQAKFLAVTGRHTAWPNYLSSRISEFTDGLSNSILLVESADSEVNWLEPRDIPYGLAVKRREAAVGPRLVGRFGGTTVGLADGRVRPFPESFEKRLLASILTVGSTGENLLPERNGEPLPPQAFPPQRESSSFVMTDVLPYPSMPISHGRNYLYCATFRIAWDGLRPAPGTPVVLQPMPAIAAELNRLPFSLNNLDSESYFAKSADRVDVAKMKDELHRRFPGAAGPTTLPESKEGRGRVLFAYLLKSLPFAAAFDGKTGPLLFPNGSTTEQVASFGRTQGSAVEVFAEATRQIVITDYRTDEDFIVELKTESPRDVMLLAKIPAESTMQATIDKVLKRAASPNSLHKRFTLEHREDLMIPKLSLNILKSYDELIPVEIVNSAFSKSGPREYIFKAEQATAFVLNERGAELESTAEIGSTGDFGDDGPPPPPPPPIRKFHFDRPFLVLLRETQSHEPYFAVWLENAELMEPFPK